ncbi:MAG: CRISPR-associated helicase Cas3' [Nocardiopsaceae bacterium]|nr:CRISPR-associated helicase Cas3' [Nocardiopsaceae bacterium]
MTTFAELFLAATGYDPHGYQSRIASDGLPDVVRAPTGTGKTGIILAWLWRRLYGDPDETPRRLVYALPQRSLVEQVSGDAAKWLANLGLEDQVALHVVMGGRKADLGEWREDMHKPAIVVGTVDSLVSKVLNRGYGIGRATFPIDFALTTNGAHWIIDEIQLCRESTTTLRQLAAFAERYKTAEPFGLTCMSATVPKDLLQTVDNPDIGTVTEIRLEERAGELATRLDAKRTVRRLGTDPGDYKAIAEAARELHRPQTLTLVVLNTIEAARSVYKAIKNAPAGTVLLHSRFRGIERTKLMQEITENPNGRILISTQVVEAGIDLSARTLITEAAPWTSLVQRAGRCNRTGTMNEEAELRWVSPKQPAPYLDEDIKATSAQLEQLEGYGVTGEDLLACGIQPTPQQVRVLRRPDFLDLFDTSPDLSGADVDIAPYIRDADDLDAEVAWATWTPVDASGAPASAIKMPAAEYRCRVSLGDVVKLTKNRSVWRFDQAADKYTKVGSSGRLRPRPGELLLVSAADGGYDPETGFDLAARGPVANSPELHTAAELEALMAGAEDAFAADDLSVEYRDWQSLDEHSEKTRDQAEALARILKPDIDDAPLRSAITAAYLHDLGKAHPIWQDALCALATAEDEARVAAGRPWAKSGGKGGALRFAGGVAFRHELASVLLLDGPYCHLLDVAPDPDLARYAVLAHHGKLRVQVRDRSDLANPDLPEGEASKDMILGLRSGMTSDIPALLGQPATQLTVDLGQFEFGAEKSWTRMVLALREKYGSFVLAYLETLVRIADWRASGGRELPE